MLKPIATLKTLKKNHFIDRHAELKSQNEGGSYILNFETPISGVVPFCLIFLKKNN